MERFEQAHPPATASSEEIEVLRRRVSELEALLAAHARATNALVAQSQEKLYWLERWQVDLDVVMRKPGAQELLAAVKAVRGASRRGRSLKRRLLG